MKLMSFDHTAQQMRNRTKDVTRRLGWRDAQPGQRVLAVVKARGVRREDREELGVIEFTSVRPELVLEVTYNEIRHEGFPGMTHSEFVGMFCRMNRCHAHTKITRIAFRWVDGMPLPPDARGGVRMNLPFTSKDDWHWRWLVFPTTWNRLHRVVRCRKRTDPPGLKRATTVCGLTGDMVMPGFMSRLGLPRCAHCCRMLGIARGNGAPYNAGLDA